MPSVFYEVMDGADLVVEAVLWIDELRGKTCEHIVGALTDRNGKRALAQAERVEVGAGRCDLSSDVLLFIGSAFDEPLTIEDPVLRVSFLSTADEEFIEPDRENAPRLLAIVWARVRLKIQRPPSHLHIALEDHAAFVADVRLKRADVAVGGLQSLEQIRSGFDFRSGLAQRRGRCERDHPDHGESKEHPCIHANHCITATDRVDPPLQWYTRVSLIRLQRIEAPAAGFTGRSFRRWFNPIVIHFD